MQYILGEGKKRKKRDENSSVVIIQHVIVIDREERQIQINLLLLLQNIYLEIIRNCSLLLGESSGNAARIWLSLALIPVVEWKANLVQLLFPE